MNKKKKAFTLTELLVVVVVIGVLSAVVLPKFSKVIETRRTTEAEELMGAIRTEQEKRCALDKNYLTNLSDMTDIVKSDTTKNYTLTLASTGVNASRKDKYNYTLSIPSYADGRICCSGTDCDKLNKNYPKCSEFTPEASPVACAGKVEEAPECTNGEVRGSETCNGCGTRTTQKCVNGKWTNSPGVCSKTEEECNPEPEPEPEPECTNGEVRGSHTCNGCGTQTTQKCINGMWKYELGACSKTEEDCAEKDCCDEDFTGDFAQCIAKKYGYSSDESVCARGSITLGSGTSSVKTLTGASACLWVLGMGSGTDNVTPESWVSGGYKKYACSHEKPTRPSTGSGSGTDSGTGTYTCCKVYEKPKQTFTYNNLAGEADCINATGCGVSHSECSAEYEVGALIGVRHITLDCIKSCSCPFNGHGVTVRGYVQKLGCKGSYECSQAEFSR